MTALSSGRDFAVAARARRVRLNHSFADFALKYKLVLCSAGEVSNWKLIVAEQTSVDGTEIVFRLLVAPEYSATSFALACLCLGAYFVILG